MGLMGDWTPDKAEAWYKRMDWNYMYFFGAGWCFGALTMFGIIWHYAT